MALKYSFESQGNFLFKYRGQIPVILFILAIPFIYLTDYSFLNSTTKGYLLFFSYSISFVGFLIRFYTIATTPRGTSGRNTKNQVAEQLNSSGMYSIVRHPLYLANYLIWLGISITVFNIYFVIIMSLLFWLYYERIMYAEECYLEVVFGEKYLEWSLNTPAFFPSFFNFKKSNTPFSIITILRREYASVLAAAVGFFFIEGFKNFFNIGVWVLSETSFIILFVLMIIIAILRSIKHYTNFLNEEGRS